MVVGYFRFGSRTGVRSGGSVRRRWDATVRASCAWRLAAGCPSLAATWRPTTRRRSSTRCLLSTRCRSSPGCRRCWRSALAAEWRISPPLRSSCTSINRMRLRRRPPRLRRRRRRQPPRSRRPRSPRRSSRGSCFPSCRRARHRCPVWRRCRRWRHRRRRRSSRCRRRWQHVTSWRRPLDAVSICASRASTHWDWRLENTPRVSEPV